MAFSRDYYDAKPGGVPYSSSEKNRVARSGRAASAAFQTKAYSRAAELYQQLYAQWPADVRAPEALIGLANTQQVQGDAKGAKKTLETVVAQYPGTSSADTARQRLKQMASKK